MLKKLIKIKNEQSDNESDAIDIYHSDNELELEEEVNKMETSSSEDEDFQYIAPKKKEQRLFIIPKPKLI